MSVELGMWYLVGDKLDSKIMIDLDGTVRFIDKNGNGLDITIAHSTENQTRAEAKSTSMIDSGLGQDYDKKPDST